MIQLGRNVALLDACVLYPAPVRDLLLHMADADLFIPKWTSHIHEEWTRNLLRNRPDLSTEQLKATVRAMNIAFPYADVTKYESRIKTLELPDSNDRHVLAAAIQCEAKVIVTSNTKDFPVGYLSQFDIIPQHPDLFVTEMIRHDSISVLNAFLRQVSHLRNPVKEPLEVLGILKRLGMVNASNLLQALL